MSALAVVYALAGALVAVGAGLALVRLTRGPAILDRAVALDVVGACATAAFALIAVVWHRPDALVLMILMALTAHLAPIAIARFATREDRQGSADEVPFPPEDAAGADARGEADPRPGRGA